MARQLTLGNLGGMVQTRSTDGAIRNLVSSLQGFGDIAEGRNDFLEEQQVQRGERNDDAALAAIAGSSLDTLNADAAAARQQIEASGGRFDEATFTKALADRNALLRSNRANNLAYEEGLANQTQRVNNEKARASYDDFLLQRNNALQADLNLGLGGPGPGEGGGLSADEQALTDRYSSTDVLASQLADSGADFATINNTLALYEQSFAGQDREAASKVETAKQKQLLQISNNEIAGRANVAKINADAKLAKAKIDSYNKKKKYSLKDDDYGGILSEMAQYTNDVLPDQTWGPESNKAAQSIIDKYRAEGIGGQYPTASQILEGLKLSTYLGFDVPGWKDDVGFADYSVIEQSITRAMNDDLATNPTKAGNLELASKLRKQGNLSAENKKLLKQLEEKEAALRAARSDRGGYKVTPTVTVPENIGYASAFTNSTPANFKYNEKMLMAEIESKATGVPIAEIIRRQKQ